MRLASYNVENLFDRAKVMMLDDWQEGRTTLENFAAANKILGQQIYSAADKTALAQLLIDLGLEKSDESPFVILRRNRGELLKRPTAGGIEILADGRADWVGSLELKEAPVNHESMLNTARVISDLNADVLGVVEAESRPVLSQFNKDIISAVGGAPYDHVMVIDGNDTRGIDVGILTKSDFPIIRMASHVDDRQANGEFVFSRDCPEYEIRTKNGNDLYVLVNHLKSKGYGSPATSNAKRLAQATRVAAIVKALLDRGINYVAVIGDLNDTPTNPPLQPLITSGLLQDAYNHANFDNGGFPGTYGSCTAANKIDYLFLSPDLYGKVQAGGVIRTGMWPGVRPKKWDVYPTLVKPVQAASDHAALWVDLDI
jgi:endonuclease/exonuclease/phosphatase family metal-dependent hydrolase